MQCRTVKFVDTSSFRFILLSLAYPNIQQMSHFAPPTFFPKSSTYGLWDSLESFGCSRRVPARGPPPSSRRALVRRAGSDPSRGELKPDNKRIDISLGPALAWGKRCLPAATLLGGGGAWCEWHTCDRHHRRRHRRAVGAGCPH